MGLKGKLIASMEVRCGGHLIHDMFHTNIHHIRNISPKLINHCEIHEGEIGKIGTVLSWKYIDDGKEKFLKEEIKHIDPQKKSITWEVIEGDVLELYNFFIITTSSEHQWTTVTFEYEKKTENIPEPLSFLDYFVNVMKDMEGHLLSK
uniref:Bet v I/Major latex protein domain-containing protein n=1 Tax=Solanum lycopersicum TaxID=4081 RepID=A0A3Q7GWB0_SOLLC|nr:MLP-like protein 34 [Solanum lycopersicum]